MIQLELPLALLGLGALVLPIAIHAIARRTPRDLALPTLRFLDAAPKARRALARPRDGLLLLLRCAALAIFALAAAVPFLPGTHASATPDALVLILDDSLSMAHGRPLSRFDRARAALEKELAALPAGGRAAVLLASHPASALGAPSEARERLREARPLASSSALLPALEAAAALVASVPAARVVLASDLDRPSLEGLERRSQAASALSLTTIDVGNGASHDASFAELEVSPSPAVAGEPVTVSARLRAVGLGDGPVPVELEVDGRTIDSLPARPGERVSFTIPPRTDAFLSGALVARAPADELPLDDRASFALPVVHDVPVVILGKDAAAPGSGGREQPLVDALSAIAKAQGLSIAVSSVDETQLEAALAGASVLVLASPGELQGATRDAIADFAGRGGGLLAWLDEEAPAATIRALAEKGVLPATAAPLEAGPAAPLHLERASAFEAALARALSGLEVAPQSVLRPLAGADVVLDSASGGPLWVERGRAVVLGFAPWGRNASLAREAALPLLVRAALHAALGAGRARPVEAGSALALADLARLAGKPLDVIQAATLVAPDGSRRSLAGETAIVACVPGTYTIENAGGALAVFAVNASEREALLERATESARLRLAGPGAVRAARSEPGARDLTAAFALAGLACLLLAALVAQRGTALPIAAGPIASRPEPAVAGRTS
jgi:hypothetical protein